MTSKIFKSIVSVAVAAITACLVIITGVLYSYFGNLQQTQLKDELSLAANAVEQMGEGYLETLDSDRYRLTWVDTDGTVIFDSHADVASMENHKNREEIAQAFKHGFGSSIRHSTTLTEETIYEAVLLDDGSVLRISVSRATAVVLIWGMAQPIALVLVIAIALSAWLARSMAMRIVEPMNKLNLEKPLENEAYEELSPLLRRIHAQHQEIKHQMLTLKQKQDEFDQITGNMKEVLILLDNNGRIISINPAAKRLYEVQKDCTGDDFFTIDRKQDMRLAINEANEKGNAYFHTKKNGRDYQFDVSRIDSDGKMRGLVVLAFDVTEQVNAEKHRREFTANVSHELKTPLQTIIGSAELMEIGIVKEEDMPRFVKTIRREATRLVSLIDDIIRLSQLDEGAEMQTEDVSLKVVAEEVKETLSDAAKLKGVQVELSGDDGLIKGVRRLLYEVVYNLCDNAIKYNKSGGWVKIAVEETDNNVKLSVSDNGMGIPAEHHEKIFERFYRVDKSHSKQSGGTGLGLSIVKHAVQYHHGKISIESQPDVGTTISVVFDKV
ncbi:MAG: PAS domain-containing protein [Oscillospiraceae bacterium]|nr:PAS domain-containing protein [Oscillospiraceae bacterium]